MMINPYYDKISPGVKKFSEDSFVFNFESITT